MRARTGSLTGGILVAAAVLFVGGLLVGAGFRYWNALPAETVAVLDGPTFAALAALALGLVLLIELERSRGQLKSIDRWAIVSVAALAGVLAGLMNGPLPNNVRTFSGTASLELTSPIKARFTTATTVQCETVPGTDQIAWLSATSMEPVATPELATATPEASGGLETPAPDLPALNLYLTIGGGLPPGISIAESPTDEPMTGLAASLEIVAVGQSGRATFAGLHTDEAWIGEPVGGDLAGSVRWDCSDRQPDEVAELGG